MIQLSGHCSQASQVLGSLNAFSHRTFGFEQFRAHELLVGFTTGQDVVDYIENSMTESRLLLSYIHARISSDMVLCGEISAFCP